jgi:hypothetical protein
VLAIPSDFDKYLIVSMLHYIYAQIVHQYDIIVIQEVRGFREPTKIPNGILEWVNQDGSDYAICNSALTYKPDRSSHRELNLFLYR